MKKIFSLIFLLTIVSMPQALAENEDGDSYPDSVDLCPEKFDEAGTNFDFDNDGLGGACDVCPWTPLSAEHTEDTDPLGDRDGDGIYNRCDWCPDQKGYWDDEMQFWNHNDADGDYIGDVCDDDIDGDGILNEDDPCPYNEASCVLGQTPAPVVQEATSSVGDDEPLSFSIEYNMPAAPASGTTVRGNTTTTTDVGIIKQGSVSLTRNGDTVANACGGGVCSDDGIGATKFNKLVAGTENTYVLTVDPADYHITTKVCVKRWQPSSGGHDCFSAGTMITMADGTKKDITEIKAGDQVASLDGETSLVQDITKQELPSGTAVVLINDELETTTSHALLVQTAEGDLVWKAIAPDSINDTEFSRYALSESPLKEGDLLVTNNGTNS